MESADIRSKKTLLFFLLFCTIGLCLGFFGQRFHELGRSEEENYEIYSKHFVMITGSEDSELWDRVYESALEEGKARGVYVERFGENLAAEHGRNDRLKLAIQASVDGIIVPGDEKAETISLINQAVKSKIPVVTVLTDSTGSLRQCFVGNSNYNLGQEYGRQMIRLLKEQGWAEESAWKEGQTVNVLVLIDESRRDTSQNLILLGIRETLDKDLGEGHSVAVDTRSVDNTRSFSSEESIRDIFLDPKKLPDILVCLSAVHTRCAYQAAVDLNKVGTIQILGYYDSETILDGVAKNILCATAALDTDQMGRRCVEALDEYMETGYTNSYRAVDTRLITWEEARKLLEGEP